MTLPEYLGPILFSRGVVADQHRLDALVVSRAQSEPPSLCPMDGQSVTPTELMSAHDRIVWRYGFSLPLDRQAFYRLGDVRHEVAGDATGDVRIAYVSCNGQEHEDASVSTEVRNRMWRRLGEEHDRAPFHLMLHGGDQLYADQVVQAHPTLAAWADASLDAKAGYAFTDEARDAAERYLFQRYANLYSQPAIARLLACIPSVMMWDDHDIIDGWGSHPAELLDSPVGRGLFEVARRMFMAFQMGTTEAPAATGKSLTQWLSFPGFDVIAPDLRSERRPDRVMGPDGWAATEDAVGRTPPPARRLIMSSVPLLGPRLSWIERLIGVVPKLRRYEDDLRDQWQSRAHREEWRRFLTLLDQAAAKNGSAYTVLSGEIHLATRAEMALGGGGTLHQLVASGIAHPPPPEVYASGLGWLAKFGEDPLPDKPIRLRPLPGHKRVYVAERNYLVLERAGTRWTASWELEDSGRTSPLDI